MRKIFKTLALLLVVAFVLPCFAACSNDDTIEIFSTKSENAVILQRLIDDYNAQTTGKKARLNSPSDAGTTLRIRLLKNRIPDIILMGGDYTYTEFQSSMIFADLSDADFTGEIRDSYKNMLYALNKNGEEKLYGIPFAANAAGLIYNKTVFENNGLQPPETWDELITLCDTLKAKGITPFALGAKDNWTLMTPWNCLSAMLQPDGFNEARRNDEGVTYQNTPEYVEICDKMTTLMTYGQADILGTSYNDSNTMFASGRAAMYVTGAGSWVLPEITRLNPDIQLEMIPFPASNVKSDIKVISGIDVLMAMSESTNNRDDSLAFMEFLLRPENSKRYIDDQFAFSAVKEVEQQTASTQKMMELMDAERILDFVDHMYPAGFDAGPLVQGYVSSKNQSSFLKMFDQEYDRANKLVKATS